MTHFLNHIRDYTDTHAQAAEVIAVAVSLFSLVFVFVSELIDLRQKRNEQRFNDRKDAMIARLNRTRRA